MGLHPQARAFLDQVAEAGLPTLDQLSPVEAREQARIGIELVGPGPAVAVVEDFVITAGYDPLHGEGLAYGDRLAAAGGLAAHYHYDDMIHAFFSFVNVLERGNEAVAQVAAEIRAVTGAPAGV
jgi:acetyl esterase/lipase